MSRKERFMPGGVPRFIHVYDNGGKTLDNFTVVFTRGIRQGEADGHLRTYFDICMNGAPFHPQGICQHGESQGIPIDCPSGKHLGRRIRFQDLPVDCRKVVRQDYKYLYDLDKKGAVQCSR